MYCTDFISDWIEKYLPDADIAFDTETMTSGGTLGRTTASKLSDGSYTATIYINEKLATGGLIERSIAWHEFNHLYTFVVDGAMGHGSNFWKAGFRKPFLLIAVYLCFPLVIWKLIR